VRVVVVGAGMSGCVAGLAAAEAGHDVVILEAAARIGGVLGDHDFDGHRWYRNCQYLNPDQPWVQWLATLAELPLEVFDHHYGSWNDLFGTKVWWNDFAQPVVRGVLASPMDGTLSFASLDDRLRAYPPRVSEPIRRWATRYGDLTLLDADNANPLQVGRVLLADDIEGVRKERFASVVADQLYGLPRTLRAASIEPAALPVGGWSAAMVRIAAALERRGAVLRCRSTVRPSLSAEGKLQVAVRGEIVPADLVVWCANPNPLVTALGLRPLDSWVTRMLNLLGEVESGMPAQPMYWQIFARGSPLVRVYAYRLRERALATFEAFDDDTPATELEESVRSISGDLGLGLTAESLRRVSDRRFVLLTQRDREVLRELEEHAVGIGLVTGGWHTYGRDPRIAHVLSNLRRWAER
jgi:glycine/D-amino acid oxidase-like deaminating enzyme